MVCPWIVGNQSAHRKYRLSKAQREALEGMPVGFGTLSRLPGVAESGGYENSLKQKATQEYHMDSSPEDGFGLGVWVTAQRVKYRKEKLPIKKQKELEIINGWYGISMMRAGSISSLV